MKKKLVGILSACLALSLGGAVLAACAPTEPEVTEGAIYVTEAKSFWAGVGSGYLSFEYKEEPETPAEGERYGYVFHVMVDSGDGYSSYMSGNWELEETEGNYGTLSLTGYWDSSIENPTMLDGAESGVAKTYEPTDGKYTIGVSIPSAGVLDFVLDPVADKVGEGETPEPEKPCTNHVDENGDGKCDVCGEDMPEEEQPGEGEIQIALWASASASPYAGMNIKADAMLELYTDNTWTMLLKTDMPDPNADYTEAASGTWTLDTTTYATTLTVTNQTVADSLPETLTVTCDASAYPDLKYSADVTYVSYGIEFKFAFTDNEPVEETHYTVSFDFGNGQIVQVLTSTFEAADGTKKEYIPAVSAPATNNSNAPYVRGKRFAGWDTSKNPVLEDGVSTTKFLLDVNSNSYFDVGAIEKDVMEVTDDMTVYARWVEPQWVETEEDLRNMKNDLSGWYILKNDIALTEEWMPVGTYYASYEYLSASWWKYAFSGALDGNGYSIKGLHITTLEPYGDTVHPTEGSGNGTTALFGSICDAEISDLVIESPVIDIDYSNEHHGYAAVVAGFAQQSPKIVNVYVVDAKIDIETTDVDYIAISAFIGGHWGGEVTHCTSTGTINVVAKYTEAYDVGSTNLYVGGIAGEGYGWIDDTVSDMDISLTIQDARAAAEDPTAGITNNVYMGSIGASTTYTENVSASGALKLDFSAVSNTPVSAYLGGIGGIQRYGYLDYSETDTQISVKSNQKEGNTLYVGSLLGGYDAITSIINLQGFNDLKARQCTDRGVSYTLNTAEQTVDFIGYAPKTAEEMMVATIVAQAMGIDLTPYMDADGNYTIYGTDRCERVTE